MDILICRDDQTNADGPVTEGPPGDPAWSLYATVPPGPWWEDWDMTRYGSGLTYPQALALADECGLKGRLIS